MFSVLNINMLKLDLMKRSFLAFITDLIISTFQLHNKSNMFMWLDCSLDGKEQFYSSLIPGFLQKASFEIEDKGSFDYSIQFNSSKRKIILDKYQGLA